ncbi:hypothetical protein, partial [Variovorax sp. GT1P44]|uniref:hypothetical protein n=1 Tax=Variovorax sp. GT1P44 TaxID=3443742 RepID=UPI003F483FFB
HRRRLRGMRHAAGGQVFVVAKHLTWESSPNPSAQQGQVHLGFESCTFSAHLQEFQRLTAALHAASAEAELDSEWKMLCGTT